MIVIVVSGLAYETRRYELDRDVVEIGRSPESDIVLDGDNVSSQHARIVRERGQVLLVDRGSTNGTLLNYRRIDTPAIVRNGDRFRIGNHMLELQRCDVVAAPAVEAVERDLLAAIAQHDPGSRLAYADWLEEREDVSRAEFVRRQDELVVEGAHGAAAERLRTFGGPLDPAWRRAVSRAPIEQCRVEFRFRCPREWGALSATAEEGVRFCSGCQQDVFYVWSHREAYEHAVRGRCVALDPMVRRTAGDGTIGARQCERCECAVSFGASACPRCGGALPIEEERVAPTIGMISLPDLEALRRS